jgi:hypothetical protein
MTNVDTTPEQEVNTAPEETVNDEQETEQTDDASVSDLHEEDSDTKKVPESVPKARLDKEINRRKELEAELAKLKEQKEDDPDVDDVKKDPDVKDLAEKLAKIEQKERRERMEVKFAENLNKTLENMPEFKDVVNPEVIKQMAFNPANKDKTYRQLLEEAYGNALGGRRTTETTTPRGGANPTKVDIDRARTDTAYRREVLADPEMRKQYNQGIENRIPM